MKFICKTICQCLKLWWFCPCVHYVLLSLYFFFCFIPFFLSDSKYLTMWLRYNPNVLKLCYLRVIVMMSICHFLRPCIGCRKALILHDDYMIDPLLSLVHTCSPTFPSKPSLSLLDLTKNWLLRLIWTWSAPKPY